MIDLSVSYPQSLTTMLKQSNYYEIRRFLMLTVIIIIILSLFLHC